MNHRPSTINLTSPTEVRRILARIDLHPSKALGQNFLIDRNVLDIILDAAELGADDHVLEIGPGLGVVTNPLLNRAGRVTAIEKDHRLAGYLREQFRDSDRIILHEADALDMDLPNLIRGEGITGFVSNLPYLAGTRILMDIFMGDARVPRMVVTLQRDVADRLIAQPRDAEYGILSVWAQLDYDVKIRKTIKPTCFYPVPGVDSALVVLRLRGKPRADIGDRAGFAKLVKYAFSHRRKQIQSLLIRGPGDFRVAKEKAPVLLETLGIDPKARPEAISTEQWAALSNRLLSASQK